MITKESLHAEANREIGDIKTNEYEYAFFFEKWFIGKEDEITTWFEEYWSYSLIIALVYCIAIFMGHRYMRTREALNLQTPLILWSGSLAIFSILGTIRSLPEAFYIIRDYGLRASLCHPCYFYGVPGFWAFVFVMSKLVEMGDTFFVIARKQRLNFLHWYHHATVFLYVFYTYPEHAAAGRWFSCMNYFVHSFMYSYYTLRALKIKLPPQLAMSITSMQILQMIVGNCIFFYMALLRTPFLLGLSLARPQFCQISNANVFWGSLMYFSYLLLFIDFFMKAYISSSSAAVKSGNNKSIKNVETQMEKNGDQLKKSRIIKKVE